MLKNDLINLVNNFFIKEFNLPFEQPKINSNKSLLFTRELKNCKVYLEYFFDEQDSNNDQMVCNVKFKNLVQVSLTHELLTDITQTLNHLKLIIDTANLSLVSN